MSFEKRQWLRLYADIVDDDKLGLLAFQDRWHFVAILALKASGLLDDECDPNLKRRRVAYKLGITELELEELARRMSDVDLIDRKTLQPLAWEQRQFDNDSSAERTRRWRERKNAKDVQCDGHRDVTVTPPDTETESEHIHPPRAREADEAEATAAMSPGTPSPGALATRAMIDAGMPPTRVNPSHPELLRALETVTPAELADVVRECLGRGTGPPAMVYVIRTAVGRRNTAARQQESPDADPATHRPTSSGSASAGRARSAVGRQLDAIKRRRAREAADVADMDASGAVVGGEDG